ncbi:MAG: PaaX family transcriptional regulator C-terminal domain-containing protein [Kofleriaceae bacterium]
MTQKPTAKRIVLELLTATDSHTGSAANLVAAGAVLGVDEGNIRVALARLVAAGTLELAGRGEYRLGATTRALTAQVTSWRELEKQVRTWDGGWACVQLGELGRSDRSALRRRERALKLHGFRELARTFAMRPDNLAGGIATLRTQLHAIGLDERAVIFRATDLDANTERRARALWDADKLTQTYRQTIARISRFLVSITELAPRSAAREAFFFGSDVLRMIMFDPRLPEPLVDVRARRGLLDAARRLDFAGRRLWAQLFALPHGLVVTAEDHHDYS